MQDLSLHVLDIVENSLRFNARLVEIKLTEDLEQDLLTLEIKDDGAGMDMKMLAKAQDPFFTTKPGKRVGLGLALLSQAAREAGGRMDVSSSPGRGTAIKAVFKNSHPDRKPVGEMESTLQALVGGHPHVDFVFEHKKGNQIERFDTRDIRRK